MEFDENVNVSEGNGAENVEKKYGFTSETMVVDGHELHRIVALDDIFDSDGNKIVKKDDLGGWIESEDNLSQDGSCWVEDEAMVFGHARVEDNANISGNAKVFENARVYGNALIYGESIVSGDASVYGNANVSGKAIINGSAKVWENAVIGENARIEENATVSGNAKVGGNVILSGNASALDNAVLTGDKHYVNKSVLSGRDDDNAETETPEDEKAEQENMPKFEILMDDFKEIDGRKLFRIRALRDIPSNRNFPPSVKAGDLGGWVESEDNLSQEGNCWIYNNACVFGNASIKDNAAVTHDAVVSDNALVAGDAIVGGKARVHDSAVISEEAAIGKNAEVYGNAVVRGQSVLLQDVKAYNNAYIDGDKLSGVEVSKAGIQCDEVKRLAEKLSNAAESSNAGIIQGIVNKRVCMASACSIIPKRYPGADVGAMMKNITDMYAEINESLGIQVNASEVAGSMAMGFGSVSMAKNIANLVSVSLLRKLPGFNEEDISASLSQSSYSALTYTAGAAYMDAVSDLCKKTGKKPNELTAEEITEGTAKYVKDNQKMLVPMVSNASVSLGKVCRSFVLSLKRSIKRAMFSKASDMMEKLSEENKAETEEKKIETEDRKPSKEELQRIAYSQGYGR